MTEQINPNYKLALERIESAIRSMSNNLSKTLESIENEVSMIVDSVDEHASEKRRPAIMDRPRHSLDQESDMEIEMILDTDEIPYYVTPRPMIHTDGSAGYDLHCVNWEKGTPKTGYERLFEIRPRQIVDFGTGTRLHIKNPDIVGNLYLRSSWCKKGLQLTNSVGVIDSDYQGEIICQVRNDSDRPVFVERGDRFAQIVFHRIVRPWLRKVSRFSEETSRGEGGFGSTGTR